MAKRKKESKSLLAYLKTHVPRGYIDQDIQEQDERLKQRRILSERRPKCTTEDYSTQESIAEEVEQLSFRPPEHFISDNVSDWFPHLHQQAPSSQKQIMDQNQQEEEDPFYFYDTGFELPPLQSQQQPEFISTQDSRISEFTDHGQEGERIEVSDIESTQEQACVFDDRISLSDSQSDRDDVEELEAEDFTLIDNQTDEELPSPPDDYEEKEVQDDISLNARIPKRAAVDVINSQTFILPHQLPYSLPPEQLEEEPMAEVEVTGEVNTDEENEEVFAGFDIPAGMSIPRLPEFRYSPKKAKEDRQVVFKPGGLAARASNVVTEEKKNIVNWESKFNHELQVNDTSILKACQKTDDEVYMFRAVESWMESGLVLAWCVQLNQDEIVHMLEQQPPKKHNSSANSCSNNNKSNDSSPSTGNSSKSRNKPILEEATSSQPHYLLPKYTPRKDDERMLFAFSFSYNQLPFKTQEELINYDRIIAIWPPWTSINIQVDGQDIEVNLATQFKADGI